MVEQPQEEPRAGPATVGKPPQVISRPGCVAADNAGEVMYHLEGLGYEGKTNFGVLRVSKERLEEAARAAEIAGDPQVAKDYRGIAQQLPEVHDAAKAREMLELLRPVAFRAWDLGARCKSSLSTEQLGKAREVARQVREGDLTMGQAIKEVRQE